MSDLNLTINPIIGLENEQEYSPHLPDQISFIADADLPVLIIGESGTGKEYLARSINRSSGRKDGAFRVIDLSAVAEHALNKELFGCFDNNTFQPGKIELADKGTLLIKGIDTMPANTQAKLLRLMRENIIYPQDSPKALPVDVRIMATAKRDFAEKVEQGLFCEDLYRLISANTIHLSPLRTCRDDLTMIIEKKIKQFADKYHKSTLFLEPEAKLRLINYDWPGNFREIESRLERLVFLSQNGYIQKETLNVGF